MRLTQQPVIGDAQISQPESKSCAPTCSRASARCKGYLYLRTGAENYLFERTGFAASYRMLADSPRRDHARPNLPSARVTLPVPAGSSTAGAQLCLHDSAKFSSKTA